MKVKYVIDYLERKDTLLQAIDRKDNRFIKWQEKKTLAVIKELEDGHNPLHLKPIRLILHDHKHEFRIDDGRSHLVAFFQRDIGKIKVELRLGTW